ncbi:TIGR01459 family HAD-type hydrolase [Rhodobacter sp. Har01]|uniref:TIGR01459 family HAD-type hydrolase n=1 Tax=Rhodobacter sp. Har01 TaxID=2883999 RepID=UPI001D0806F4|nr:TIGR01459 family HAD-type hydrolase [Rhodobacter sp. Har01]MCB6179193.1 TIGR01459 family HAD-type hydrolase [Rhodobacter sp. Har01]
MTQIISALADISRRHQAVYCDLWGCLHNGKAAFPQAVEALRSFRAGGGAVVLLTNAPRPKSSVAEQMLRLGVPGDAWDEIATSGDAAQFALASGAVGRKVFHIGAPKDESFFTDLAPDIAEFAKGQPPVTRVPLQQADGVVCTGLRDDLTETPQDYRAELLMAKTLGLPMLCANPDIVVDFGDRRLWCAGALARDYEAMGGRALYFGKPHPPIYDLARRRLEAIRGDVGAILCIGDGIDTDIQGGIAEGLDTLFITGGIDAAAFGPDPERPDPDLLQVWLDKRQLSATFAMGHLR